MVNPFPHRTHAVMAGVLVTLAVLSMVGANLFLTGQNRKLRSLVEDLDMNLQLQRAFGEFDAVLARADHVPPERLVPALQDVCQRRGLAMADIQSPDGRSLFHRCDVAMPEEMARLISAADVLEKTAVRNHLLRTPVDLGSTRSGAQLVMGRAALRRADGTPRFVIFFAFFKSNPDWTDSFEIMIAMMQTILVVSLIVLGWFALRRMTRPYEAMIREIRGKEGAQTPRSTGQDELSFLVGSFKEVIRQLREKESQLEEMHRQARKRAESSEKYARDILAGLRQGVICFDHQGVFLDCNPAAEELLGRARVSMKNLPYDRLFEKSPAISTGLRAFFDDHAPALRNNLPLRLPDGSERTVIFAVSMLSDPNGAFYGAILVLEDETEKAHLRQTLQAQENLAALGEMSAGIAHELKNSLATISGYSQMILGNARPGTEQKRAAALVQEVEGMARVISDFLEYARPIHADKAPLSLDEMLEGLVAEFREKYPEIAFTLEAVPAVVAGDAHILRKAFQNVLLNAVQALNTTRKPEKRVVVVMEALSGGLVRVRVADNGPGIEDKVLGRIFTPFFTTRADGTGMGLPVVQKIVAAHEGSVNVESNPDGGAEVEFNFPSASRGRA
ncbi:MAG: PAS domain-containing protein [Acidobacteria bacterium]|nr:PAS domain-containing protein [Acidobacteriota bacterium]